MFYQFDEMIDRRNTNSLKYDFAKESGKPDDILPLWVADMDFQTPEEVTQALVKTARHAIFGYSDTKGDYFNAVRSWFVNHFDYEVQPEWLVKAPGVVCAISMAVRAFTNKGDSVLIQRPVYPPFSNAVLLNERKLVNSPLVYRDGKYDIDFDDFERKIIENRVKLFILCHPHNPVGRVWTKEELLRIGSICLRQNCLVVSDEIHCDFVYNGHQHHVFATLDPRYPENSIICTAPSKTFNLAGLQVANIFIANEALRHTYQKELEKTGYSQLNAMGLVACQSAYEHGADWLRQLNDYLTRNVSFLNAFIAERLPKIKVVEPEGTYLIWLDFSAYGLTQEELDRILVNEAKIWLNSGVLFGPEGQGFQRINIACPAKVLETALLRLESAMKDK